MFDAIECREHARRYAMMAAETDDPHLKQRFEETAAGWLRLAADCEPRRPIGEVADRRERCRLAA